MLLSAAGAAVVTAVLFLVAGKQARLTRPNPNTPLPVPLGSVPPSLDACVFPPVPPADAATVEAILAPPPLPAAADPALINLLCAPGVTADERTAHLQTLDAMAAAISDATARNYHRYQQNPAEFDSEACWRLAMMCTVLGQDFGIRYDPALTSTAQLTASNRQFFANSDRVFLNGCLGPARTGTCASLPVLYVALGHRLGYPMHLVAAKAHLFARWDDGQGTRVNLEAANAGGFTTHPDSHYRTWPFPLSPAEEESGGYLQNLDASRMLAIFLCTRALCLQSTGQSTDATRAASAAFTIAPALGGMAECLQSMIGPRSRQPDPALAEIRRQHQLDMIPGLPRDPQPGLPQPRIPIPRPSPYPTQPHTVPGMPPQPTVPHQTR